MSQAELHFLGQRNYVQAANILEVALQRLQAELGLASLEELLVLKFKQSKELASLMEIVPGHQKVPAEALCATLTIDIGGQVAEYQIIASDKQISDRQEESYKQSDYLEVSSDTASARVSGTVDFWELVREAVQLTKVFHINKYNLQKQYRFVSGGFEQIRYFEPEKDESFIITSQIMQHMARKGTIYNKTKIILESNQRTETFILPFIGMEKE